MNRCKFCSVQCNICIETHALVMGCNDQKRKYLYNSVDYNGGSSLARLLFFPGETNLEGGETMKKRLGIIILSGVLTVITALPMTISAAPGSGKMRRNVSQTQTRTKDQTQDRLRLRDGSCMERATTQSGTMNKGGNTYGPGDGTGNMGVGPKDGTGYGAPSQR
ncbi:MAG: hypothetical protein A2Y81_08105 [Nitrospirae bacterium RBG_13_43_8]|nr:MAG: hypothetical protein A2Y81_08105 [Nitrospirae bacterium RBG_13_43_8]